MRIQFGAVGDDREIEQAAAQGPVSLVPLGGGAVGVTPGVGGIVERAGVDQRPVHEILARILRIFVGIEHVGDRELADGDNQPVGGLRTGELI